MRFATIQSLFLALLFISTIWNPVQAQTRVPNGPVKHFIVLMLENRSFDHMLGWMKEENPEIHGLNGNETNPWDLKDPSGRTLKVTKTALDANERKLPRDTLEQAVPDPDHSVEGTLEQIYGTKTPDIGAKRTMNGFVMSARERFDDPDVQTVMDCWPPSNVPIITTLAKEFVNFDEYFCSVPGPTHVNRLYFHSGTSFGFGFNSVPQLIWGYAHTSLYELLDAKNYTWVSYFEEAPDPLWFQYTRQLKFVDRFRMFQDFARDAQSNNLPTFSFLSPRYFGVLGGLANDQHPAHAVSAGEQLMKEVYETLRNSPSWENSALFITYDEHGGFYDSYPPTENVPNPDGLDSLNPPFKFDRLGIRVPAILISPWVDRQLVHSPPAHTRPAHNSQYEHSSMIHTLTKILGLDAPLTNRTAWAAPFDHLFNRKTPRTDAPLRLPPVVIPDAYFKAKQHRPEWKQPLHQMQKELVYMVNTVAGLKPDANMDKLTNEHEAGTYLKQLMMQWKTKGKALAKQE